MAEDSILQMQKMQRHKAITAAGVAKMRARKDAEKDFGLIAKDMAADEQFKEMLQLRKDRYAKCPDCGLTRNRETLPECLCKEEKRIQEETRAFVLEKEGKFREQREKYGSPNAGRPRKN